MKDELKPSQAARDAAAQTLADVLWNDSRLGWTCKKGDLVSALKDAADAILSPIERTRNTLWLSHHYWLQAAKEALQGDPGKLRRHVAISEGLTRETVLDGMAEALLNASPKGDIAVEQRHRDAYAEIHEAIFGSEGGDAKLGHARILNGERDEEFGVQAFARFERDLLTPPQPEGE